MGQHEAFYKRPAIFIVADSMTINCSIMITGSRDVEREAARAFFEQHLSSFVSQGRTWLVGTARGVDQWAMEWPLENSETCCAVVPYKRFEQPQWAQSELDELDRIVELVETTPKFVARALNKTLIRAGS